jgi:hypothetical protein
MPTARSPPDRPWTINRRFVEPAGRSRPRRIRGHMADRPDRPASTASHPRRPRLSGRLSRTLARDGMEQRGNGTAHEARAARFPHRRATRCRALPCYRARPARGDPGWTAPLSERVARVGARGGRRGRPGGGCRTLTRVARRTPRCYALRSPARHRTRDRRLQRRRGRPVARPRWRHLENGPRQSRTSDPSYRVPRWRASWPARSRTASSWRARARRASARGPASDAATSRVR